MRVIISIAMKYKVVEKSSLCTEMHKLDFLDDLCYYRATGRCSE